MKRGCPTFLFCCVALLAIFAHSARASETDQFMLPPDKPFVDLGGYFSRTTYKSLVKVVTETNDKIRRALRESRGARRADRLAELHSPRYIAAEVADDYGAGFVETEQLESLFHSKSVRAKFPGKVVAYKTGDWI